jgi:small subunit ribosomal protein S19
MPKIPNIPHYLIKKLYSENRPESIKVWNRSTTIVTAMVGVTFEVHNGKTHIPVKVTEQMVGHKLGEFSPTRPMRRIHNSTKK